MIGHHGRVVEQTGKGLVLVVEDERPIADLVRLYLTRDGFGVHVEQDGTAGLAAARRVRPVACVLDIRLLGMDGTEICRRLRESGFIKANPNKILADGTDWRFFNELKRELKG